VVASDCISNGNKVSLIKTYDELRTQATVKSKDTFVSDELLEAVNAVLVQEFSDDLGALVLHPRLDQIDRIDHGRTNSATNRSQQESVYLK